MSRGASQYVSPVTSAPKPQGTSKYRFLGPVMIYQSKSQRTGIDLSFLSPFKYHCTTAIVIKLEGKLESPGPGPTLEFWV
jgi:hypothetical protein